MEGTDNTTEIELTVNVKKFDKEKNVLIDTIECSAKLSKADAGRILENPNVRSLEETVSINVDIDLCSAAGQSECGCPKIAASYEAKISKADAGVAA